MRTGFSRQFLQFFSDAYPRMSFPQPFKSVLEYILPFFLQMPELREQHDKAIMRSYVSKEADVEELKEEAKKEWELQQARTSTRPCPYS